MQEKTFLGAAERTVRDTIRRLERDEVIPRLWAKDGSLWSPEPSVQSAVQNRLGWLDAPRMMRGRSDFLKTFAQDVREAGFTQAVVLGMGGSSLGAEVCRKVFGVRRGFPDLTVLDSTVPAAVHRVDRLLDLRRTLFIVASKSGSTIEVDALFRYFYGRVQAKRKDKTGDHFIAITDAGTPLARLAEEKKFRAVWINPADIGGRFSVLSYFGLVPMALMGVEVGGVLDRAVSMSEACGPSVPADRNPAARLGGIWAALHQQKKDKIGFVLSPKLMPFGLWAEQLVAESTGKQGKGLLPISGEPNQFLIAMRLASEKSAEQDRLIGRLERAGHPVVRIILKDREDLGAEFFRWETATAAAGALMGVNPFDEPDVADSKRRTLAVLESGRAETVSGDGQAPADLFKTVKPGDYVAVLAYLSDEPAVRRRLEAIRTAIRNRYELPVALNFGPRYLHSTGQIYKGGPPTGRFLLLTADDAKDIPIPGVDYSFGRLKLAQAMGDAGALRQRGRPVAHLHFDKNLLAGLDRLKKAIARGWTNGWVKHTT
jgi:glucose-6-phosphate isomerase